MARIRTVKPEIHQDEAVGAASDSAFRVYIGLITLADDHGRLKGDPRLIGAQVWPYRPRPAEEVEPILAELAELDLIERYTVDGKPYICLPTWADHQRISNAGKPRHPGPDEADSGDSRQFAASRGESPQFAAGSRTKDQGEDQGSGSEDARARASLPSHLHPVAQALDRVAFSRDIPSPKIAALSATCERYADRDIPYEAEKFARYYTDGAGENRPMRDVVEAFDRWLETSPSAAKARGGGIESKLDRDLADLAAERDRLLAEEGAEAA